MRETSMGQSREKNPLCDKIGTKFYSSIAFTWVSHTLRYAHNPHNFIIQYSFLYGALIFLFHTLPGVIPATLFSLFCTTLYGWKFLYKKWSLATCIYKQFLKAKDGLHWWEFRQFLIGRKNNNILLVWKRASVVAVVEEFEEKKWQQFWFLKKEKSMATYHSYNGDWPYQISPSRPMHQLKVGNLLTSSRSPCWHSWHIMQVFLL